MAPTFVASALSFTVVTTGPTMPPRCTAATGRSWVSRAYADGDRRGLRGLGPLPAGLAVQYLPAPLHLSFAVHAVAVVGCLVLVLSAPRPSCRW